MTFGACYVSLHFCTFARFSGNCSAELAQLACNSSDRAVSFLTLLTEVPAESSAGIFKMVMYLLVTAHQTGKHKGEVGLLLTECSGNRWVLYKQHKHQEQ